MTGAVFQDTELPSLRIHFFASLNGLALCKILFIIYLFNSESNSWHIKLTDSSDSFNTLTNVLVDFTSLVETSYVIGDQLQIELAT